jgi:hypothetical protein
MSFVRAAALLLVTMGVMSAVAAAPGAARIKGRAVGVRGPVVVRAGGETVKVEADGAFELPAAAGAALKLEVVSQPADRDCRVAPEQATVPPAGLEVTLTCRELGLAAKPMLPADKATVSPLVGKVVLVVTRPMREPPGGTFLLEAKDGESWVDTGLAATSQFDAATREWRFTVASRVFPANKVLRVTVTPTAGKDDKGEVLAKAPIRWTFTTGKNPLQARGEKGGCPVDEKKPEPCD